MAGFIRSQIPQDCEVILTSDWHIGSKAFSYDAFEQMLDWLKADDNRRVIFNGDLIEGKPVKSKHYDPESLEPNMATAEQQVDYVRPRLREISDRILAFGYGNHDLYLRPDYDWMRVLARELGIEKKLGGYQTWIELTKKLRVFMFHGRRSLPKGAKDPVQRKANRLAWLKRELEDLASSCHVMVMGHVHWLAVLPPIQSVGLFNEDSNVRRHAYIQPESTMVINGKRVLHVPRESRWYCCSGTLRKSGSFDYIDYSEIAGHVPAAIGWLEMTVDGGRCADIREVVV